eukprot:3135631-Pyramimonas_sp.AAC.1
MDRWVRGGKRGRERVGRQRDRGRGIEGERGVRGGERAGVHEGYTWTMRATRGPLSKGLLDLKDAFLFIRADAPWDVGRLGIDPELNPKTLDDAFILRWSGPRKPWTSNGLYKSR